MKPNTTHSKSKTFHQGIELEDVLEFVAGTVEVERQEAPSEPGQPQRLTNHLLKTKYVVTVTKYNT